MQAVLELLTTSADQSAIMQQMDPNHSGLEMEQEDESIIEHEGKKYSRI